MKIKKVYQGTVPDNKIVNAYSTSQTDTYSCNYINGIIESGSNTYGNYIKYADGTLVCTRIINIDSASVSTQWGGLYIYDNRAPYNFAHEFISTPTVQKTFVAVSGAGAFMGDYGNSSVSTTGFTGWSLMRPTSADVTGSIHVTAIGRWK